MRTNFSELVRELIISTIVSMAKRYEEFGQEVF
jgi:hypothetical protein